MSQLIKVDKEYAEWIKSVGNRFKTMQIKAATRVNQEMIRFYWLLGKDIVERHAESKWGSGFYNNLSQDLVNTMPGIKSFSPTNLKYMKYFYQLYSGIRPQVVDKTEDEISPQLVDELFLVPWGHHRYIIDKCKGNTEKALFYIRKTIECNWSRAVLMNFLDTDLFERQGQAITNFQYSLPKENCDLARELTKDPYNFDFLTITNGYNEKELKDALMDNVQKFLMELGTGFAFVGREYRLQIGNTEQYIDMLFYNIKRHCYVVVEVKVVDFEPGFISQTATYVSAVNHILKEDNDTQTIGILICKTKDNVLAKYAVETSNEPIGISEYELSALMPKEFKGTLPTIEELEAGLT